MKKVIFIVPFLFYFSVSYAQNTYYGNVILISQESVDNFGAWDYDEIQGELIIHPYAPATETDISDLTALLPLKKVDKVKIEHNPHLKNLHGLDSLQYVKKTVWITYNDSLQSLNGLDHIHQSLDDNLRFFIGYNPQLSTLDGFPSGMHKLSEISLSDNKNLMDISALSNLDSVGSIYFRKCKFPNLQALNNLQKLRNLDIFESQIKDINLPNVKGKNLNIRIDDNPLLKNISGFNLVTDTLPINGTNIEIINNLNLQSISAFNNIKHYFQVIIENNNSLKEINNVFNSAETLDYELSIKHNPLLQSFGPFTHPFPKTVRNIDISFNNSLTSVEGLMGLKRVDSPYSNEGELNLRENPALTTLSGLDSLKYTNYISFRFTNVSTLSALHNLDSIGFGLTIADVGKLKTLNGLENLSFIKEGFAGYKLKYLKDISALNVSPIYIGKIIYLYECDSLSSEIDISNIHPIRNMARFMFNPSIKTIKGSPFVDSLKSDLTIVSNQSLERIENFDQLLFTNDLTLSNNPALTDISGLCPLFTQGTIAGAIDIHDNATGFNSVAEIQDWCMTPTEDLPMYDAIAVYPNPATDVFQIEVPMDLIGVGMMVDLVDISGTSHFSARIKNTVSTIPVDDLSPGLYFLRIVFDGRMVQVKKVVVER